MHPGALAALRTIGMARLDTSPCGCYDGRNPAPGESWNESR
jgi:hypothetical protein